MRTSLLAFASSLVLLAACTVPKGSPTGGGGSGGEEQGGDGGADSTTGGAGQGGAGGGGSTSTTSTDTGTGTSTDTGTDTGTGTGTGDQNGGPREIWLNAKTPGLSEAELKGYGARRACIVNQGAIDANDDGIFDAGSAFDNAVKGCDPSFDGPLVLDWEGQDGASQGFIYALSGKSGPAAQQAALKQAIQALKAAKALRPKAKVGYYNVPYNGGYYKAPLDQPQWWKDQVTTLKPLLDLSDALFPSTYQPYHLGVEITADKDHTIESSYMALTIHAAAGKPVYPYVWHRLDKKPYDEVLSNQQIYDHLEGIMAGQYGGKHIDGVVWWASTKDPVPDATAKGVLKTLREGLDEKPFSQ
jgi:hypothetical protein